MIRPVLLSALLLSPAAATPAAEQPLPPAPAAGPMVVTSDTGAYCESLSLQIGQQAEPLPQAVVSLRNQGRHLCAAGAVRSGINRLRRALMILRDPADAGAMETGAGDGR